MDATPTRQKYERLRCALDAVRQRQWATWLSLAENFCPYRPQFYVGDQNRGDRRDSKILDNTATLAIRTYKAGMMSGVTTPARPWFGITTRDTQLAADEGVKDYLFACTGIIRDLFGGSNLYAKLPQAYEDLAVFGTGNLCVVEDDHDVLRFLTMPPGTYWIATDEQERVDTVIRQVQMTNRQMSRRFRDRVPHEVQRAVDSGNGESTREVYQAVTRAESFDPSRPGMEGMPWRSCWWAACGGDGDPLLEEKGFESMPILVPRWEVGGNDVWGRGPGIDALGDAISLQAYESKAHKAVDKLLDPALMGPATLKQSRVSLVPGDITWLDQASLQAGGVRPIHNVNFDLTAGEAKEAQIRQRIERTFYSDLFRMMIELDRRNITAREVDERSQEKLLELGPLLQQLNCDLYGPLIDRAWLIAERRGLLPKPPEILQGQALQIEYLSIAAQAQKAVGISATQSFLGFVGRAAQIQPAVLDVVDGDVAVTEVADQLGINPKIVRDPKVVAQIRQQRAAAAQQQQQSAQQLEQAKLAQSLAGIPMQGDSALSRIAQVSG
jgi:hypothetical protein